MWNGSTYPDFPSYFEAVAGRPFDKGGELEETYRFVHEFKPELFGATLDEATAERFLHEHGGARPGAGRKKADDGREVIETIPAEHLKPANNQGDNVTLKPARGNRSDYLRARLKMHHPAVSQDLDAGKYKSVDSAAIAAGIIRVPTTLETILRLLPRIDHPDLLDRESAPPRPDEDDEELLHRTPLYPGQEVARRRPQERRGREDQREESSF